MRLHRVKITTTSLPMDSLPMDNKDSDQPRAIAQNWPVSLLSLNTELISVSHSSLDNGPELCYWSHTLKGFLGTMRIIYKRNISLVLISNRVENDPKFMECQYTFITTLCMQNRVQQRTFGKKKLTKTKQKTFHVKLPQHELSTSGQINICALGHFCWSSWLGITGGSTFLAF